MLEPCREQLEIFVDALFRHASKEGFVSLRAFYEEDNAKPFRITPTSLTGGFKFLVDAAEDDARRAATFPNPVVFCPPLAVFTNEARARQIDIAQGLALSVECDQHPQDALAKLEQILGPPTIIVASGGKWTDTKTGQVYEKLHLHWRLATPASGADLAKLKQARDLATRLVGGDPSNMPVCHPIRWPGSWHRKAEPILCQIKSELPDREIVLDTALTALTAAAPAVATKPNGKAKDASDIFTAYGAHAKSDWTDLVQGVISGENYHGALVPLAAKYLAAGMSDGAAVNMLRALMESSTGPHDGRWATRYADIPRAVSTAREKYSNAGQETPTPPLPWLNISNWDNEPVPEPEWAVLDRVPLRHVTLFSGEGAAGKSTEQLHLSAAHALARDWLGTMPEPGPSIFMDAEDDKNILHRRLAAVVSHYQVTFKDAVEGGLHLISLAGHDPVLAAASRSGRIEPTSRYKQLLEAAGDIRPKMVGIASSANVFAGSEMDRSQVQQFIDLLTAVAQRADGAVVLISHPSLTGINTDTGLSGNTQWHNAVRARFYMKGIKPEAGEQADSDLREIVFKKNNYGPISESIVVRYQDGLFLPLPGMTSLDRAVKEAKAAEVFLDLLLRFEKENRHVGSNAGRNYAPALFAQEQEAKRSGLTSKAFESAMRHLFKEGKIWNEPCGKPSRPAFRLTLKT
jgi:RecA-family ATPase